MSDMSDIDMAMWEEMMKDPAKLQEYLAAGEASGKIKLAETQGARAQAMRNTAMPEMRQAGRVAVAASPLEALSTGISRVQGQQGLDASAKATTDALASKTAGAKTFGDTLTKVQAMRALAKKQKNPPDTEGMLPGWDWEDERQGLEQSY